MPHSDTKVSQSTDVPAPPADPAALKAVADAGFAVGTLAGNHIYDAGDAGVADTIAHARAAVAMYEGPVARAAIDAGAHAVFAHHAHIMRGIEVHRGRPIFHGLGNFATVTHALTPSASHGADELRAWAERRTKLYGFAPDPEMPFYPFHPESRNTIVALCRFDEEGIREAGFAPCWIDEKGRPVPVGPEERGVTGYVESITREARLNGRFTTKETEVLIDLSES